ncbi:putative arsenate reductase ArsC3 [Halomonas sp. A3H3]|uniref:arsenate reductase ArsC n=1 Tax=Halomonas sp. A3H3 TaxID=1346287 RepID=UPI00038D829D|nr:arsenate reductase ArsC [Halomonas sp. A3H3]CDG56091.1 putative arsenate reductase ArsC3 [Halomonas sp. A3H3]
MNVLFLCTGNSCRSIYAEALFNHLTETRHRAWSGGSHPVGEVNPLTLIWLEKAGISTRGLTSKSWDDLEVTPDVVITVCDDAAGEACPLFLGRAVRVHWGVPDPSKAEGSEAEIEAAFASAFGALRRRIEAMLALPLDELPSDALQQALEEIHQRASREEAPQGDTP